MKIFTAFSLAFSLVNAQWPVDLQATIIRELEHLILDGSSTNLKSMISPCSQYIDSTTGKPDAKLGRQTAAEWIRTTFHDFITGNRYTLQGGLDASIGFETARDENVGDAFKDALINFSYYYSSAVSMADLVAIGTVLAAGHCGGTPVSLRGGRKDATAAGPTGVPKPQDPLQQQLIQFANAGFESRDDVIALTACGHSLGGVRKKSFPEVINGNPVGTQEGTDGRVAFDSSVNNFDNTLVKEYLTSTGLKGGPLVTTSDVTRQSDLRLYTSDQNQTMTRLSQSTEYFNNQCSALFRRMIELVPSGVRLSDPVSPSTTTNLKPYNVDLNIDWKGAMTLTGSLRYIQVAGAGAAPGSYDVKLVGRNGQVTSTQVTATKSASDTGTGLYGPTYQYKFQLKFPATTGVSGIQVGTTKFPLQDTMFVVPGLSSITPKPPAFAPSPALEVKANYAANLTVAYLSTTPPPALQATLSLPTPQTGSVAPKIDASTTLDLKLIGKTNGYGVYSGKLTKELSAKQVYGMSLDVAASGQQGGLGFYKVVRV